MEYTICPHCGKVAGLVDDRCQCYAEDTRGGLEPIKTHTLDVSGSTPDPATSFTKAETDQMKALVWAFDRIFGKPEVK